MLLLFVSLILAIAVSVVLAPAKDGEGMEEFCRLECTEQKIRDRSVCC
jgi:hypothetical protein